LIIFILLAAAAVYVFTLPPKPISIKDIHPTVIPHTIPQEPPPPDTTHNDRSEIYDEVKVRVEYYIIIESFKDLTIAQQKADRLKKKFNTDIIVLSPTAEGYYRISYGKYSTLEEAKTSLKGIKTNIRSDAWIFSVEK